MPITKTQRIPPAEARARAQHEELHALLSRAELSQWDAWEATALSLDRQGDAEAAAEARRMSSRVAPRAPQRAGRRLRDVY